jgi:antitoxin component YwqK of YwqJK toxin-antitoxin module
MRILWLLCFISFGLSAQQQNGGQFTAPITSLYSDTAPNLDYLPKKKRDFKIKEKKIPRTVFYGVKTKRGYAITGKGKDRVVEVFYYLPAYKEPDPYVPQVYWFNMKKRKVMNTPILEKDKKYAKLLHGPYLRKTKYQIFEDGIFYLGTKHGRWERYDKNEILIEKVKYFHGWTRESMISYYDQDHKKMQEITPIEHGVKTGKYYRFYESGILAEEGSYAENQKVGTWIEYYEDRKKRKKITQFPKDPFDTETQPVVLKEWDANGRLIFDKASEEQIEKRKKQTQQRK